MELGFAMQTEPYLKAAQFRGTVIALNVLMRVIVGGLMANLLNLALSNFSCLINA